MWVRVPPSEPTGRSKRWHCGWLLTSKNVGSIPTARTKTYDGGMPRPHAPQVNLDEIAQMNMAASRSRFRTMGVGDSTGDTCLVSGADGIVPSWITVNDQVNDYGFSFALDPGLYAMWVNGTAGAGVVASNLLNLNIEFIDYMGSGNEFNVNVLTQGTPGAVSNFNSSVLVNASDAGFAGLAGSPINRPASRVPAGSALHIAVHPSPVIITTQPTALSIELGLQFAKIG